MREEDETLRRLLMLGGALAAVLVAAFALGGGRVANADPFSYHFDASIDDAAPGNGTLDPGDVVDIDTYVQLDVATPSTSDEPFFDVASTQWDAIGFPCSADVSGCPFPFTVPTGDVVGSNQFTIWTNIELPAGTSVTGTAVNACGDPGGTRLQVVANFSIYAAVVNASVSGIVATVDTDSDQIPQDQEDNDANGLPDGVDDVPDWVPLFNTALGLTPAFFGRGYGVAPVPPEVVPGPDAGDVSVNFNLYALGDIDGDTDTDFLSFTVLAVPAPFAAATPTASQVVNTCTPFDTLVDLLPVSSPGGVPVRYILPGGPAGGSGNYRLLLSSADDYDGDNVATYEDNCKAVPNASQADGDGDQLGDACDPDPGTPSGLTTIPGLLVYDEDGDNWANTEDNCETVSNQTQADTDSDGVGDACDPAPQTEGNGAGYMAISGGIYHDHDDIYVDVWASGGPNDPGDFAGGSPEPIGLSSRFAVAATLAAQFIDSSDNLSPDCINLPGTLIRDHGSDRDGDGYSDSDEAGGLPLGGCNSSSTLDDGIASDPLKMCSGADAGNLNKIRSDVVPNMSINIFDFSAAAQFFGQSAGSTTDPRWEAAVPNFNNSVNIFDFSTMANFFGQAVSCS